MQLTSLIAATGFAAATHAFLVPPQMSEAEVKTTVEIYEAIGAVSMADQKDMKVPCPGCDLRFESPSGRIHTKKMREQSSLDLHFQVERNVVAGGVDRLLVNGFELYPKSNPFASDLMAMVLPEHCPKGKSTHGNVEEKKEKPHHETHENHEEKQQPSEDKEEEEEEELKKARRSKSADGKRRHKVKTHNRRLKNVPQRLGYSLSIHPVATDNTEQLELVSIDLQVIEVGSKYVDGIPAIHINLIHDKNGALSMGDIVAVEGQPAHTTPMVEAGKECTTALCRWAAMVEAQFRRAKGGCRGMMNKMGHGNVNAGHNGHKHHMHGHGHHRSWLQLLKKVASHVLLPVLIGVVAGVSVSLIGMVVGTVIVAVWRTFFRRAHHHRRSGHARHKATLKEAAVHEEKSGLMADQEPPPSYPEAEAEAEAGAVPESEQPKSI